MKKTLIASLLLALGLSSVSANSLYTNMSLLEQGLNNVQKGYLYNSPELLAYGVRTLVDANDALTDEDMRSVLPKGASVVAIDNLTKAMGKHIIELQNAIETNNTPKAVDAYSNVVRDCIACHIAIRDR